MFTAAIKTSTSRGCGTPTVVRTQTSPGLVTSVNLGTESVDRIIVVSGSDQGNWTNFNFTINGQPPLSLFNGYSSSGGTVAFGIWKIPTGTTASFSSSPQNIHPLTVYAIYGWVDYKVLQFNSYYGFDSNDWNFNTGQLPSNTILFGTWATNEDGDASLKQYNFGVSNRYFFNSSQVDGGSAYELTTEYVASRNIICDISGKRRSYGFLALTCSNSVV